jgi:integrase
MPTVDMQARWVERVELPAEGRSEYLDKKLHGLGLRVSATGRKTWFVVYRVKGDPTLRRLTLEPFPAMSLATARERASVALLAAERGQDPAGRKQEEKKAPNFNDLADEYLAKYAKAPRSDGRPQKLTWYEDERKIEVDLKPQWGKRKAKDITRRDVADLLDAIRARGSHVQANRTLALVSRMFNWALDRGMVERNPAHRMKAPTEEVARERVLTEDEIRRLWPAFEALSLRADGKGTTPEGTRLAAMFKVRLLTAQRGGEVSLMRWEDIDRRVWTIPKEFTKTKERDHTVPLSPAVIAIIEGLSETRTGWVFPSARAEGKPITNIRKAAERVVKATGIDFTPHDLRRTAATMLTTMGVPRLVVSKILNHAEGGTTWKYDRNPYDAEKRDALDRWADRLAEILAGKPGKIRELAPVRTAARKAARRGAAK